MIQALPRREHVMNLRALSRREQDVLIDLLQHPAWIVRMWVQSKNGKSGKWRFVVWNTSYVEISPYILRSLQNRELLGVEYLGYSDNQIVGYHLTDAGRTFARTLALESFITTFGVRPAW